MRLVADENFNGAILRGLIRRLPKLDLVRVQDVGLMNAEDPMILDWTAGEQRILLTHDVATITLCTGQNLGNAYHTRVSDDQTQMPTL